MYIELSDTVLDNLRQKHIFVLNSEIDSKIISKICSEMAEAVSENKAKKLTLAINSQGGSAMAALMFSNFVATLPSNVKLVGVVTNMCASAAVTILQCCESRLALKNTFFLIHNSGYTFKGLQDDEDLHEKIALKVAGYQDLGEFTKDLQCKRIGITRKKWGQLCREGDLVGTPNITSKKALELNLIDRVIPRFELF